MKRVMAAAIVATTAALLLAISAKSASAAATIDAFTVGASTSQAGGHPDLTTSFTLADAGNPEVARNIEFNTPEGVFGNPNAIDRCSVEDFALNQCQSASQAGLITIHANYSGDPNHLLGTAPIYNRVPVGDETGLFGFVVPTLNIPISIPVDVRTAGDYGLRFTVAQITQLTPLASAELTFWGFPAEVANDDERFPKGSLGSPAGCPGVSAADITGPSCLNGGEVSAAITEHPMINNPSTCTGEPLPATLEVETYQDPAARSSAESPYPAVTGCFAMTFSPVLLATTTTSETDSPSGLDIQMQAPQPLGRATTPSPIRSATLTLPPGLTINPDAADGQRACSDEDANFGTEAPAECPDNAKIGTFSVGSPSLDEPLVGSLYFGEPKPGDQYRLFLVADGSGIHAKFLGSFRPDPETGRVTAFIEDLPQVSFDDFQLHLFASDRGLMATPTHCSVYEVQADFIPWNSVLAPVNSTQIFGLDSGPGGSECPPQIRPFEPRLRAGMSSSIAGGFSSFFLKLDRDDGDQFIRDLNFTMPEGFTGSLVGIDYCSEGQIAHAANNPGRTELADPSCPASSQIGTSNVAAGPGSHPFHALGKMYLSGPFKGAPLSLVVVTPALAGPYDYGTQVVRVAIHVDPLTAQVRALSDTVPEIIGGVPLRLRSIRVNIDRENFTINPTGCQEKSIDSQGIGDQGTVVDFSSRFHADNCAALGFRPKMRFRQLGGRRGTRRSVNPGLLIDLWTSRRQANLRRIAVILPNHFQIDQSNLGNICSEAELVENDCAGRQAIGKGWTKTPLLDEALTGNVYAVSGSGGLPRLAFILEGQVRIVPRADTTTTKGERLKTVVPVIPDATVGHFRFKLNGGRKGYLVNNRSLCAGKRPQVVVRYLGHNGRKHAQRIRVKTACAKRGKARRASVGSASAVG